MAEKAETATKKTTAKKTTAKKTAAAKKTASKKTAAKSSKDKYNLIIVESPAKAKTIENFLGKGYRVAASNGHLIDLPKSKIGVDIENDFEPQYIVIRGRTSILKELQNTAAKADKVYLATDPDREGEAISWHLANRFGFEPDKVCRIEFNEITKTAVTNAIKNPRTVDINRVNAQQARRVLDRLVGYKLSPLLWRKVRPGLSAGRVQSVAVELIVDRENEIRAFVPEEYWTLSAMLADHAETQDFEAKFWGMDGDKYVPANEEETNAVLSRLENAKYIVTDVKRSQMQRRPAAPFTTSTLQQDAASKLNFTTKKTMMVAQSLYEGISIRGHVVGLITYMRTDSTRISAEAQSAAREIILDKYGEEYVPEKPNIYTTKKNAQDAHEAIRPSYLEHSPESIKEFLSNDQYKLYRLIYTRFMASQMTPAKYDTLRYEIDANGCLFRASGRKMTFKGFTAVYKDDKDEKDAIRLPSMEAGEECILRSLLPKQNFTQPPARYTEETLVRALEEKGIGRPSTYAPIISTIQERKYVRKDKKTILPTELGEIVTDIMKKNFSSVINEKFTADMENQLDDIESEGKDWKGVLREFYEPFSELLGKVEENLEHVDMPDRPAGIICEKCGAEMVYKMGRYGEFIACPNYPTCKNTKPIRNVIPTPCPVCGGEVLQKKGRRGAIFYGCSNYPECNFVSWDYPLEEKCSVCGKYMVRHRTQNGVSFKRCSDPECSSHHKKKQEETEE